VKSREVRILDDAAEDLLSAKAFYAKQALWLGDYFVECMLAELGSLRVHGGIHGLSFGYHRLICRRFPYAAYYEIAGPWVSVVAILDMRRRPSWIKRSLILRAKARP
jgi:hypothetical protein